MVEESASSLGISTTKTGCWDKTRGSISNMAQTLWDCSAAWETVATDVAIDVESRMLLLQGEATRVAIENPLFGMDGSDQAS